MSTPELKIGHGYDVHRLVEGRKLILGGVEIPHEKGLLGHSDADVLAHALMDALLGAMRAGDIGQLFQIQTLLMKALILWCFCPMLCSLFVTRALNLWTVIAPLQLKRLSCFLIVRL